MKVISSDKCFDVRKFQVVFANHPKYNWYITQSSNFKARQTWQVSRGLKLNFQHKGSTCFSLIRLLNLVKKFMPQHQMFLGNHLSSKQKFCPNARDKHLNKASCWVVLRNQENSFRFDSESVNIKTARKKTQETYPKSFLTALKSFLKQQTTKGVSFWRKQYR